MRKESYATPASRTTGDVYVHKFTSEIHKRAFIDPGYACTIEIS